MQSRLTFYYNAQFLERLSMGKQHVYNKVQADQLERITELLTTMVEIQKEANMKLENLNDVLILMMTEDQFNDYQEMKAAFEGDVHDED